MSRKPYMPLMVGDWIKGTRGMRAETRGVYLGLLLHQWENGWIPESLEELSLIEPEVGKVWDNPRDRLVDKFTKLSTGRLQNQRLEEVRAFWQKQRKNGLEGGRPPKETQTVTQTVTQTNEKGKPKQEPSYDIDHDNEGNSKREEGTGRRDQDDRPLEVRLRAAMDERTIESIQMKARMAYPGIDIQMELQRFIAKVLDGSDFYKEHSVAGLRLAFHNQLRTAKPQSKTTTNGDKKQQHTDQLITEYYARHGGGQHP